MPLDISAGAFQLTLPDGWAQVPLGSEATAYFERADKRWGVYVRALDFTSAEGASDPASRARHVQEVHAESFKWLEPAPWLGDRTDQRPAEQGFTSILAQYDAKNRYRVVSCVQMHRNRGCHVTIHNYLCSHPRQSDRDASSIIQTIRRPTQS